MNFETFINKYSFVNSKFVKNFYNIIKEDYIERYNEFLIDSEILRKWLQIKNRRIFNDTIKRSYKKNMDYIINKVKNWKIFSSFFIFMRLYPIIHSIKYRNRPNFFYICNI
jgi:hypothetical protein